MSVIEAVLSFDGRHVGELEASLTAYLETDGTLLIEFCSSGDPKQRIAATWLIRAVLAAGRDSALDLWTYFSCLSVETEPTALLHLLQSVQFAPEAASPHREAVARFLEHERTLLAVWSLDAFVRIALETGEGLDEAHRRVDLALSDQKPSVRARARHLALLLGL